MLCDYITEVCNIRECAPPHPPSFLKISPSLKVYHMNVFLSFARSIQKCPSARNQELIGPSAVFRARTHPKHAHRVTRQCNITELSSLFVLSHIKGQIQLKFK